MTPKEKELEKENQKLREQLDGALKRIKELEGQRPASKSHQMAEKTMELLKKGPVTTAQLKEINPKYPSDAIYYARQLLKIDVKTVRTASGTAYMLPDHYKTYLEGLEAEKAAAAAAKAASLPKEAVQQTQASA